MASQLIVLAKSRPRWNSQVVGRPSLRHLPRKQQRTKRYPWWAPGVLCIKIGGCFGISEPSTVWTTPTGIKTYPLNFEDALPFPKVGYVSSLEGRTLTCTKKHIFRMVWWTSSSQNDSTGPSLEQMWKWESNPSIGLLASNSPQISRESMELMVSKTAEPRQYLDFCCATFKYCKALWCSKTYFGD